jgi:trans-aconitate methyltransferase
VARFDFFFRVLASNLDVRKLGTVLDIGAGDAWFAEQLTLRAAPTRIVCWDTGYTAEMLAGGSPQGNGSIHLVAARPADAFDLLLFLDVLEHIEDAERFLGTIIDENLARGGHVLVSVPAWPALFSSHDVHLRHNRRYTPGAARALLRGAGLRIVRSAGLFHSLVIPRAMQVARERVTGWSDPPADVGEWKASQAMTSLVRTALMCDARLSLLESWLGWSLPGLSWWALCRRASEPEARRA